MIAYENTKTISDLVKQAGEIHGDRVFLRYEKDDVVKRCNISTVFEVLRSNCRLGATGR